MDAPPFSPQTGRAIKLKTLFWLSVVGLFYIYAGYPLLAAFWARIQPCPVRKGPFRTSVSVVISVYGEAHRLEPKLRSLLEAEGSEDIVEVLIGSDGSPDDVAGAVGRVGDLRLHAVIFQERRGKASVLNDLVPRTSGEIVVLTDARQPLERRALRALLENFADPSIGVVSGELVFRSAGESTPASSGVDAYWRYEKWIRRSESAFGSVPGATGALYAIRRTLFKPLPPNTLLDDVAIPMQAIQRGGRCILESGAVVYDEPSKDARSEALRKRRTIAGVAQLLRLWPEWLNPFRNRAWVAYVSHKLARLASPFLLAAAACTNVVLAREPFYRWLLAGQLVFLILAALGWLQKRGGLRSKLTGIPMMFLSLNIQTVLALWDAAAGRFEPRWSKPPVRT